MDGDLSEDNSSSAGASLSPKIMGSFPLLWTIFQHDRYLVHPFQVRGFCLTGTVTDHSHVASVQLDLVTPTSISPTPPASSPSLDANGGTDL